MFLSAIFLGSVVAVGVLSQLHCGIISIGVQYALSCSITYSCFGDILGQLLTFPFKETMGMCMIIDWSISSYWNYCFCFFAVVRLRLLVIWLDFQFVLVQNSTLQHYTLYQPSDLCDCVKDLHRLCCDSHSSSLPAVREKYSQHKVSKMTCTASLSLSQWDRHTHAHKCSHAKLG